MDIQFNCPHCQDPFIVNSKDINCGIFRHAVYKSNMKPINPHETQSKCEKLVRKELVYGCAKPFRITEKDGIYTVDICDYI